jgi:hypothetical protein
MTPPWTPRRVLEYALLGLILIIVGRITATVLQTIILGK